MMCASADQFIDFHGNIIAQHVTNENWDLNEFVMLLREKKLHWKEIFWKMWGLSNSFHCRECEENFPAFEYDLCKYRESKRFSYDKRRSSALNDLESLGEEDSLDLPSINHEIDTGHTEVRARPAKL